MPTEPTGLEGVFASNRLPVRGSEPVGPSEDYLRLLRGEINSKEYVKRLKERLRRGR